MASATPDLWLPSQLQGVTTHWLVPNYTAWRQRHMYVNNFEEMCDTVTLQHNHYTQVITSWQEVSNRSKVELSQHQYR